MNRIKILAILATLFFISSTTRYQLVSLSVAFGQQPQRVYLLVSSSIYEPLKDRLERWIQDVEKTGFKVTEKVIANESASEIRELLRNTPSLAGCFMVGDIPYAVYETTFEQPKGISNYETFPTDLYYMDLNGEWVDADKNGLFDAHKGDVAPEIWVGRLEVSATTSATKLMGKSIQGT